MTLWKRKNPAYETLKVVNLGNNKFSQDASEVFINIPPNLDELILSNNAIVGNLPNPFPCKNIRRFAIANNFLSGNLPDFLGSTPCLQELDLSNQEQLEEVV
jgi:Leucine-rich repeat (LRR) protein